MTGAWPPAATRCNSSATAPLTPRATAARSSRLEPPTPVKHSNCPRATVGAMAGRGIRRVQGVREDCLEIAQLGLEPPCGLRAPFGADSLPAHGELEVVGDQPPVVLRLQRSRQRGTPRRGA